jgi:branched-chain amino acid aminotransferase
MHRLFLHNNEILDVREKCLSAGQVGLLNGWGVFSTIRVAEGVLFAFEKHWQRMHQDARRMHVPFPDDAGAFRAALLRLVEANRARTATLRVAVVRNRGGLFEGPDQARDFDVIAFTSDINPWGESVRLAIKENGRYAENEFAGAKILSWAQNLTWYEEAHQRGFDEVILLNERGEVSECTSANIFAATGREVATPPLSSGCLAGVSRELLLQEIHVPGISVVEKILRPADLERADQVFITSTTRDLMPVSAVEGLQVKSQGLAVVEQLAQAFAAYRDVYVRKNTPVTLDKITV